MLFSTLLSPFQTYQPFPSGLCLDCSTVRVSSLGGKMCVRNWLGGLFMRVPIRSNASMHGSIQEVWVPQGPAVCVCPFSNLEQ